MLMYYAMSCKEIFNKEFLCTINCNVVNFGVELSANYSIERL